MNRVWVSDYNGIPRGDGGPRSKWGAYACTSCGGVVLAMGEPGAYIGSNAMPHIVAVFPRTRTVSDKLPGAARKFFSRPWTFCTRPMPPL